jgi:hypothetical protein
LFATSSVTNNCHVFFRPGRIISPNCLAIIIENKPAILFYGMDKYKHDSFPLKE